MIGQPKKSLSITTILIIEAIKSRITGVAKGMASLLLSIRANGIRMPTNVRNSRKFPYHKKNRIPRNEIVAPSNARRP